MERKTFFTTDLIDPGFKNIKVRRGGERYK
jgi:hypothetical protein